MAYSFTTSTANLLNPLPLTLPLSPSLLSLLTDERSMEDPPPAPTLVGCQGLEQFLLLAKTAKGPAVCELIKQTLEAPGVYVFGELLETECVKELASGTHANYVQLLEIFAFGTYRDYKSKRTMTVLQHSETRQTKFIVSHQCPLTTRSATSTIITPFQTMICPLLIVVP